MILILVVESMKSQGLLSRKIAARIDRGCSMGRPRRIMLEKGQSKVSKK
jgi:hypothetical protein